MKTAVMYGGGNIGRGFIGKVFADSGYEVCFLDIMQDIIDEMNARGQYHVRIVSNAETVDTVDVNDIVFPKRGALYARLSIESCGIEDDVYFSDDDVSLRNGLGQYYGSGIPGFGKPILIAGHNNRAFHTLGDAKLGDIVTITTSYGIYEYEITDTAIRDSKSFSRDELDLDEERLILYTCYPFTTMSLTSQRYFVYAQKISGPVVLH